MSDQDAVKKTSSGEDSRVTSRRWFLVKLGMLFNAAVGVAVAVPVIGYILGPVKKHGYRSWLSLGAIDTFPAGETRLAEFTNPSGHPWDGMTARTTCWVRHIGQGKFQVFAINCAHLGCPVRWFAQSGLFLCPCHGGAYYEDGQRASGPPERGLFEYPHKIVDGQLMIDAGELPTLATQAKLYQIQNQEKDSNPCVG